MKIRPLNIGASKRNEKGEPHMIVIAALLLGAVLGALTARKRNGNLADMLQYGTVYAIAFGIVGMLATLIIHRMAI